jgi:uncharacterized protein YifE (UPF0438 family)
MKIKFKKMLAALTVSAVLVTGCSFNPQTSGTENVSQDETVVFTFGDTTVSRGEVYIYANSVKERYELCYGGDVWSKTLDEVVTGDAETSAETAATATDIETADGTTVQENSQTEGASIESLTREDIVNEIIKVKTLVSKKADYGVDVTEDERQQLLDKAATFYNGLNDADKSEMEITEDMAYQVLYENVIAGRVMDKLLSDDSLEVSDEEARMTTFYDMCFVCYSQDASGNISPYSDEEKQIQYENALQACSMLATAQLDGNEDMDSIDKLAAYYNLSEAGEFTLSPEQILETYGQDIYDQIYNMENGDYSAVIESEYGYHVFEMIALTDAKATAANKEIIKKQRMDTLLSDTLEKWESEIDENFTYPDSVNMDAYNSIELAD